MALSTSEQIKRIAKVLKERFANLTVDETIDLATRIYDVLHQP